jgi:hypothetical protein
MPVEFSAAAFRCGHSMVRDAYTPSSGAVEFPIMPARGQHDGRHFGGSRRRPEVLTIKWERFFDLGGSPQLSFKIDARITKALFSLPPDDKALPRLNLQRGRALGLPAGSDVAHAMDEQPLTREQLGLVGTGLTPSCADALADATPLWYYILCEAHALGQGGLHLGPVGGRIVAEVLVGLLEGDPQSYLRQWPAWTPAEDAKVLGFDAADPTTFTMPDLVRFADPCFNAPKS